MIESEKQRERESTQYSLLAVGVVEVWQWWRNSKRKIYPSSLWVTVEPIQPPTSSNPTLRNADFDLTA